MPAKAVAAPWNPAAPSPLLSPPFIFRAFRIYMPSELFSVCCFPISSLRGPNEIPVPLRILSLLPDNFSSTKIYQDENNFTPLMGSPWYHSYKSPLADLILFSTASCFRGIFFHCLISTPSALFFFFLIFGVFFRFQDTHLTLSF